MIDMNVLEVRTNEGNTLVRPFDFYLKKREIVGIFGESGSGKTISTQAMFNLLPRSLVSTAVEKVIEGKNLDTLLPREYRKMIKQRTYSRSRFTIASSKKTRRLEHNSFLRVSFCFFSRWYKLQQITDLTIQYRT